MAHFVEAFEGWLVRVGPKALKFGDPYTHCFPLSLTGEFVGYSNSRLTTWAKREAFKAALELGLKPHFAELGNKQEVFW